MAEGFSELFEAMIQQCGRRPRNFGSLGDVTTHQADGVNPLSGDRIQVELQVNGDSTVIEDLRYSGAASSLTLTSASVMSDELVGLSLQAARERIEVTLKRISGESPVDPNDTDSYNVLLEIGNFPHRMGCASLPWKITHRALQNGSNSKI